MVTRIIALLAILLSVPVSANIAPECRLHTDEIRNPAIVHKFWRMTGHPFGWSGHVVDHICPLACGGADSVENMQWQDIQSGKAKDRIERTPKGYRIFCEAAKRPG